MSKETCFYLGAARMWRVEPGTMPWASDLGRGAGGLGEGLSPQTSHPALLSPQKVLICPFFLLTRAVTGSPTRGGGVSWEEPVGSNWLVRAKLSGEGGACRGHSPSPETRAIV